MSYSSQNRKIASNLLLRGGKFVENPIIEIDSDGEIISIESVSREDIDRTAGVEFYAGIMTAGFINAHCHTELSYLRGAIESGGGFATFASRIGEVRGNFTQEERLRAMRSAEAEMLREGIVGVGDIVNGDSSFEVKAQSDIQFRNFAELFGLRTTDIASVEGLLHYPTTSLTPHSTYSLNDRLFRTIAESGDEPLSIHFMESSAEAELFEGKGRLAEWYSKMGFECDFLHYGSPAQRIVASTPQDRSVMLIHNCCVTQRDIDLIMGHFTAPVYWVICPRSNRYISNLTPPTELLRTNQLNICVGTDSLASNWSLSMIEELRLLNNIPLVERLDWATRKGAAALQFDDLGDIEIGKRPHINILSGVDYTTMELTEKSRVRRIIAR
ncbi:MAG: amidohydrolase family protein [Rikenellaceae bacterium]